jgi:hypothetical protein
MWQSLSTPKRREIGTLSMRAADATSRHRCKVILALVQGKTPTIFANGGVCAKLFLNRRQRR